MSRPCRRVQLLPKPLLASVLALNASSAAAAEPEVSPAVEAAVSPAAAPAVLPAAAPLQTAPPAAAALLPAREQVARDLFEQGKLHWQSRRFADAVPLFAASFEQKALSSPLLLLADCYEQLGRLRSARDTFERAAALAQEQGEADLASRAQTRAAALGPRVPRLELRLPRPLPAGLVVTLNGTVLPPAWLNEPLPMDAGAYRVEAHAPGFEPVSLPFGISNELPQGERKVVAIALRPIPETLNRRDLALWLGGAEAVVALAGLTVAGVALYKDNGPDPEDKNDARWLAKWLGTGSALVSIPALGAAAALYYTSEAPQEPSALGLRWSGQF